MNRQQCKNTYKVTPSIQILARISSEALRWLPMRSTYAALIKNSQDIFRLSVGYLPFRSHV